MLRILFIDDDDMLRRSVERVVVRLGHSVVSVSDGADGLRIFRSSPNDFDIVIADYMLSGLSGDDLLRKVRCLRESIPIALVSGHDEIEDVLADVEGPVFALEKPISLSQWKWLFEQAVALQCSLLD